MIGRQPVRAIQIPSRRSQSNQSYSHNGNQQRRSADTMHPQRSARAPSQRQRPVEYMPPLRNVSARTQGERSGEYMTPSRTASAPTQWKCPVDYMTPPRTASAPIPRECPVEYMPPLRTACVPPQASGHPQMINVHPQLPYNVWGSTDFQNVTVPAALPQENVPSGIVQPPVWTAVPGSHLTQSQLPALQDNGTMGVPGNCHS